MAGPSNDRARDEINLSVAGRWCDYHFCFTWRDELQSLHVSVNFDMRVARERRVDIAELLMSINAQLYLGHFDLWAEDGAVIFRHVLIFPDSQVSSAQCEALLHLAVEACEHYYPAFQFVLWGNKIGAGSDGGGCARMRRAGLKGAKARRTRKRTSPRSVLLIGAGRMGSALIKGWLAAKRFSAIHVIEPSALGGAQDPGAQAGDCPSPGRFRAALPPLAAVVLAIKPQVLKGEGDLLGTLGKTGALVLSIAAGIGTTLLRSKLGGGAAVGPGDAEHARRHRPRDHRVVRGRKAVGKGSRARRGADVGAGRDALDRRRGPDGCRHRRFRLGAGLCVSAGRGARGGWPRPGSRRSDRRAARARHRCGRGRPARRPTQGRRRISGRK